MTKRIKMIVPVPLPPAALDNFARQLPRELVEPGFAVDFVAVKNGGSIGDSYYDTLLFDAFVLEAGMRAEAEGYAAICINTVSDSGLFALRSRLSIPVIGPGQASFLMACMLGKKFSVVTMWEQWRHMYEKTLTEQHLLDRLASIRHIDTRPDTAELLAGKEEVVFARLEAAARAAIDEDGADVIVLGSTTMHQSHAYLARRLEVPVLNPGLVAYKLCEMLLKLGLSHSKKAFPSPETLNDAVFDLVPSRF